MTLAAAIVIALGGGLATLGLVGRLPRGAASLGILTAAVVAILGLAGGNGVAFQVGGAALAGSDSARLLEVAWAAGLVLLGLVGLSTGGAGVITGTGLVALSAGLTALTVDGPTAAFAALAVGSLVTLLVPAIAGRLWAAGQEASPGLAARSAAAGTGAAMVGLVVTAWGGSSAGPLGSGRLVEPDAAAQAAIGLAVVAIAAVVIVRSGAIPAHLWAARFAAAVSPLAVPSALAWGVAGFSLVAIRWGVTVVGSASFSLDTADRLLILGAAVASLVLGGLAAMLHDDLEHVLGYLLVQDAGITLLAFAALRPEVAAAAATWLVASAALKTGLAAWIAASRWTFGSNRLSELGGWARRTPLLAVGAAIVIVGSVGIPGMALFDARVRLASAAFPDWLVPLVVAAGLSPLLALGRLLATGIDRPSPAVAAAPAARVGRLSIELGGWSRGGPRWWARTLAAVVRANQGFGVGLATVLLAAMGLAIAIIGVRASAG